MIGMIGATKATCAWAISTYATSSGVATMGPYASACPYVGTISNGASACASNQLRRASLLPLARFLRYEKCRGERNGRPLLFSPLSSQAGSRPIEGFPTRTGDLCYLAGHFSQSSSLQTRVSNPNGRPLLFSRLKVRYRHWLLFCFQPERETSAI